MVGDGGMVTEEEGMLFVLTLVGGKIPWLMIADIVVCAVVVVVVMFLEAGFLTSYWVKIS